MDRLFESDVSATPPALPSPGAAGFPQNGGVSASPTVPGAYWFHMITESLRNVITGAGLSPDAADLTLLFQSIQVMVNGTATSAVPTGTVAFHRRSAAPAGWVALAGGTIGSASSGATARAADDTAALFELIWAESDNAAAPIQTSSGAPGTRGASAAADFGAGKRLPLDDARGEFLRGLDSGRGVDPGRGLGSWQAGELQSHSHTVLRGASEGDNNNTVTNGWGPDEPVIPTSAAGGNETRPRNIAFLPCIKL